MTMVSMQAGRFVPIPFKDMLDPKTGRAKTRLVDIDSTRYHIARRYMIRLRKDDFHDAHELAKLAATAGLSNEEFSSKFWAIPFPFKTADQGTSVEIWHTSHNRFETNVFEGNSFDMSTNSRSTSAIVSGNWWDRYRGYDLDRNGRGDVAFRPVRLFSLLVASHPSSMILMRSAFLDLLDTAERALPILTPETLVDASPLMVTPR